MSGVLHMRRHTWGVLRRGLHGLLHRARRAVQGLTARYQPATMAIEHARLVEESGRRQAWLSRILEMNTRIAMSADLTNLLSRIAAEAAQLVGADGANLRILRGDHLMTNSQTQYGLVLPHVPALRLGEGIGGIAARDNRVVVVPDLQTHPDVPEFIKVQAAEVGLSSMVSIPVRSRHRVIGVLSVNSARPRVFTAEESAALEVCAEQAAIAIEHTQLVDEVKAQQAALAHANTVLQHEIAARHQAEEALALRIAQMEAVRTIAAEITQELALPTVLDVIVRRAVECVDVATEGIIYLWEAADEVLIPHACWGHGMWEAQLRTVRLRLGESLTGTVAQRRQGLIVNDYPQSPYVHPQALVAHLGYTAAMAEPLLYRDRLVGVIVLTNGGTKQPFTERDRAFLTLLALHATIAIENARLFAESTARQAWLERINTSLQHEITERQRVEADRERLMAALEARSAEMEHFTYSVSHDLKSPLITICGFVGLLKEDAARGELERIQTDLTYIDVATTTMQRLLDEVLELSRIGRVVNPLTEVSLSALAREAVTLVGGRLVTRGVQVHIAPDLPVVVGDRPRLLQVLQNLVDNAVKFMGAQPAPRIDIGVRQTEQETVYYVRDNGVGIEPRDHEKIFGLFERVEPAGEGTGIGLALVKRIIEVHGGRIWVESAGQGCGSTFCFTLAQSLQ
jgi:signal transduction histidine kinase